MHPIGCVGAKGREFFEIDKIHYHVRMHAMLFIKCIWYCVNYLSWPCLSKCNQRGLFMDLQIMDLFNNSPFNENLFLSLFITELIIVQWTCRSQSNCPLAQTKQMFSIEKPFTALIYWYSWHHFPQITLLLNQSYVFEKKGHGHCNGLL